VVSDEFGGASFVRAPEAPEEVVVTRAIAYTQGLQPEDLGVLVYLLLLPVDQLSSAKELAAGMRGLGWKMSIDRFEVVAKRLMMAGHLNRESVFDAKTKRPQWRYWAYRNPANNPEYVRLGTGALSQVGGEIGENPVSDRQAVEETGKSPVSPGQGRNREIPDFGESRTRNLGIQAGQGRNREIPGYAAHPPHPPEEEDPSSPYPLTRTTGAVPSPREEGPEFTPEETGRAEQFLQQMQRWQAGGATARKQAPRLLRVMRNQAWPALEDLDDEQRLLLESEIFRNTGGAKSWVKCLPGWIEDLRLYDRVRSRPGSGQGAEGRERCPEHPARYRVGCIDCAMSVPS
jgi:hypothetical protein